MVKRASPKPKYQCDTKHWVKQSTGLPCLAEIIDLRTNTGNQRTEYYVHYCNFDKRLDEWITEERFLTPAQVKELGEEYFDEDGCDREFRLTRRNLKRRFSDSFTSPQQQPLSLLPEDPVLRQLEKEHEEATRVKNIQKITIGEWEVDCWYFSPFPEEYAHCDQLWFCPKCLKYMRWEATLSRHLVDCEYVRGPPGRVIYLEGDLAVYELDGERPEMKLYCQNLCLLAKLFLDHKTIYYDVAPFLFYVLCRVGEEDACEVVGFFSKEKQSLDNYNLACIMVLPPWQRHGYGRFLMSLSYELTRREGKQGTPERPLSDLGVVSYKRFWGRELLLHLMRMKRTDNHVDLVAKRLGFTTSDVVDTLKDLNILVKNCKIQPVASKRLSELLNSKFKLKPEHVEFVPEALYWPVAQE